MVKYKVIVIFYIFSLVSCSKATRAFWKNVNDVQFDTEIGGKYFTPPMKVSSTISYTRNGKEYYHVSNFLFLDGYISYCDGKYYFTKGDSVEYQIFRTDSINASYILESIDDNLNITISHHIKCHVKVNGNFETADIFLITLYHDGKEIAKRLTRYVYIINSELIGYAYFTPASKYIVLDYIGKSVTVSEGPAFCIE